MPGYPQRYRVLGKGHDRVVFARLYLDCGGFRVSPSVLIFIEVENQEDPLMSVGESAAENTLSGRMRPNMSDKDGQEE